MKDHLSSARISVLVVLGANASVRSSLAVIVDSVSFLIRFPKTACRSGHARLLPMMCVNERPSTQIFRGRVRLSIAPCLTSFDGGQFGMDCW